MDNPHWTECEHVWVESQFYDLGGDRTVVVCNRCGVPGERDDSTGEVFWPAT